MTLKRWGARSLSVLSIEPRLYTTVCWRVASIVEYLYKQQSTVSAWLSVGRCGELRQNASEAPLQPHITYVT
jgi:hypothetical protein